MEQKRQELASAKRKASTLLGAAAGIFVITMLVPPNPWVLAIRAFTEAAMVGGLADMPIAEAGRVDHEPVAEALLGDHAADHALCHWRAADIAEAVVKDAVWRHGRLLRMSTRP